MGERDRIQQLAEWWAQASQESRWLFLRKTIEGPPSKEIPPLRLLHIAIYLAEASRGETEEGRAPGEG